MDYCQTGRFGKAWGGGGGTFLFYILSLAGLRPLGNGLAEE